MRYLFLTIIFLVLITGCNDFTSSTRYEGSFYTLTGLLHEGETVTMDNALFIGRSVDAYGGNLDEIIIDNAIVFLHNQTRNDSIQLQFFMNFSQNDEDISQIGYYDPSGSFLIHANETYYINAEIPLEESSVLLEATTIIPDTIVVNILQDASFASDPELEFPELSYEVANIEHPLTIGTYSADIVKLFFQFYCLEDFEDAEYIIDYPGIGDHPEEEEDYEDPITGIPRKIEYYAEYQPSSTNEDYYLISDNGYKPNLIFYGKYAITIYSIDDNYYNFLYKTNNYLHGGIINGFGYFGSVSGSSIFTDVIE